MDGAWTAASGSFAALAARAPEWAVAVALIVTTLGIVVCTMTAMVMAVRKLMGMGATPEQVEALLNKKINGGIDRIERSVAELRDNVRSLDDKVDARHSENQLAIGELRGALGVRRGR